MIFAGASSPGRRGGSLPYWRYFRPNTKATMAKAAMVAAKIMLATVNSMKVAPRTRRSPGAMWRAVDVSVGHLVSRLRNTVVGIDVRIVRPRHQQIPGEASRRTAERVVDDHVLTGRLELEIDHRGAAGGTLVVCTSRRGGEESDPSVYT